MARNLIFAPWMMPVAHWASCRGLCLYVVLAHPAQEDSKEPYEGLEVRLDPIGLALEDLLRILVSSDSGWITLEVAPMVVLGPPEPSPHLAVFEIGCTFFYAGLVDPLGQLERGHPTVQDRLAPVKGECGQHRCVWGRAGAGDCAC